jgi:hypothetical protein
LGRGYLLPFLQLQEAWRRKNKIWLNEYKPIAANNKRGNYVWVTLSCPVPVNILFKEIGSTLRVEFTKVEGDDV